MLLIPLVGEKVLDGSEQKSPKSASGRINTVEKILLQQPEKEFLCQVLSFMPIT